LILWIPLALCAVVACSDSEAAPTCQPGVCPDGTSCNAATGACEIGGPPALAVGRLGVHVSAVAVGDALWVGSPDHDFRELVVQRHAETTQAFRLAGRTEGSQIGEWADITTDSAGRPHVAYYDAGAGALLWSAWSDGGFLPPQVADDGGPSAADVGTHVSMVVDQSGGLHFAYRDETGQRLRLLSLTEAQTGQTYGCRPEGALDGTPLIVTAEDMAAWGMPSNDFGEYASVAITADGRLKASFYDAARGNLVLASCDGSHLSLTILDGEDAETGEDTGDVGAFSSLAMDVHGNASVAYFNRSGGTLRFAGSAFGAITIADVDDGSGCGERLPTSHVVGEGAALAVHHDPKLDIGLPRIAYRDVTGNTIRLARRSEHGVWSCSDVASAEPGEFLGAGLDVALTPDDQAHVVYGVWWREDERLGLALRRSLIAPSAPADEVSEP